MRVIYDLRHVDNLLFEYGLPSWLPALEAVIVCASAAFEIPGRR
jgi:hypothetical protein